MSEVILGALGVARDASHAARDADDEIAGIFIQQRDEIAFGLLRAAKPRPGLSQGRQDDHVALAELDGVDEVVSRGSSWFSSSSTSARLTRASREVVLEVDCAVVGIASIEQAACPGKRKAAVEVDPGEAGIPACTYGEVARGFEVAPLAEVAMAQDIPRPERCHVALEGSPQRCLGAGEITRGEERGSFEGQLVGTRRFARSGAGAVGRS